MVSRFNKCRSCVTGATAAEGAQSVFQPGGCAQVEVVGGLIEDEEIDGLSQYPGQRHTFLAAGKHPGAGTHLRPQAQAAQGGFCLPTFAHGFLNRTVRQFRLLVQEPDPRASPTAHQPGVRNVLPGQDPEESGFAGSVDAHNADSFTVGNSHRQPFKEHAPHSADGYLFHVHENSHEGIKIPARPLVQTTGSPRPDHCRHRPWHSASGQNPLVLDRCHVGARRSTVDQERRGGDEGGIVTGQESDGGGDLFGFSEAPDRDVDQPAGSSLWVLGKELPAGGAYSPGPGKGH